MRTRGIMRAGLGLLLAGLFLTVAQAQEEELKRPKGKGEPVKGAVEDRKKDESKKKDEGKKKEEGKSEKKAAADLEKARADVKKLEEEMDRLHKQMRETAEKLHRAHAEVARLQGRDRDRGRPGPWGGWQGRHERGYWRDHWGWRHGWSGHHFRRGEGAWDRDRSRGRQREDAELERKVDRLQREVEQLRREMRGRK
jgi:predicted RNase H-like nuclease (RuvC/YqgF family)